MEQGLAAMYGNGDGNTVKHSYAGDMVKKMKKKNCKKPKKG